MSISKINLALALTCLCVACESADHKSQAPGKNGRSSAYDADNTARNVADRDMQSLTAGDQGETEADRTITQNIRKALMQESSLSTTAKNIKIITKNGVVTLRGPVNTSQEMDLIMKIANSAKGNAQINNMLEVKKGS
jgi:hyperosmotically inducible protein